MTDETIYVRTQVVPQRNSSFLTAGKIYEMKDRMNSSIVDDTGNICIIHIPKCALLDNEAWEVIYPEDIDDFTGPIAKLEQRVDLLREALFPFAHYATTEIALDESSDQCVLGHRLSANDIHVGDFRKAAQAVGFDL